MRNYYDLLQVQRDASDVVITASYEALRKKYRQQKDGDPQRSERIGKLLDEAYAALSDPTIRAEYDKELEQTERRISFDGGPFEF